MELSLSASTDFLAQLIRAVPDDRLAAATPCPDYTVADMLDHINGLSLAFTAAARKSDDLAPDGPSVDGSRLPDGWRDVIPARLADLGEAWDDPEAWTGTSSAGGVTMPSEMTGLVALDEIIVHAWDLAKATGLPFAADPANLAVLHDFVASWADPSQAEMRGNIFGPVVEVPEYSTLETKVVALTGRRPEWPAG